MRGLLAALALAGLAAAAGCTPAAREGGRAAAGATDGPPWFEELSEASGLVFTHHSGHEQRYLFPEIFGGGAALLDIDGDGDLDAYLLQGGSLTRFAGTDAENRLFRNRGDGTFEDVSTASGAGDPGYAMGVAAGDYDNDGDVDLYVTNVGRNVLLRNDGTGKFRDVTVTAGVGDPGWGTSATFLDYDADGDLDLYVANYVSWSPATELDCFNAVGGPDFCLPTNYNSPARDTLYRNEGDGRFRDVSVEAGLGTSLGNGLGVVSGDFNGDGRLDIFVANDMMMNQLWINRGDGTFVDEALAMGAAVDEHGTIKAGMGITAGDPDDDGDLDAIVVNLQDQADTFFRNDGAYFVDQTASTGLISGSRWHTRFGVGLPDLDNDGRLDLYLANGRVVRAAEPVDGMEFEEENLLFRGGPGARFDEVLPRGGVTPALFGTSRAAAFGDYDDDGGIDVLVGNRDGRAQLLRNVVPDRGHWIRLRVLDEHGRDALGAVVTATLGERRLRRDVLSGYSFCAANDPRVHVGLGDAVELADIRVQWIDGTVEEFGSLPADRDGVLRRGEGSGPG